MDFVYAHTFILFKIKRYIKKDKKSILKIIKEDSFHINIYFESKAF